MLEIVDPDDWDGIIRHFDDVRQEQMCSYSLARWPFMDLAPCLFRDGETLAGAALVLVRKLPLRLGGIAVAKWGPLVGLKRAEDVPGGERRIYRKCVEALHRHFVAGQGLMLSIMPPALPGSPPWMPETLLRLGFEAGAGFAFPARYHVKLRLPLDEQRASLGQKWRYNLKKAEKAGLTFEQAEAGDGLERFSRLYRAMSARKRFPDHSAIDSLSGLMAVGSCALRPEIFLVSRHGQDIAGAVIFKAGHFAAYLYGATNDLALPLKAGYFLHWRIVEWLAANTGARWYDLGGSDGFSGLHQFKNGMTGRAGDITAMPPMFHASGSLRSRLTGRLLYRLKAAKSTLAAVHDRVSGVTKADMRKPG